MAQPIAALMLNVSIVIQTTWCSMGKNGFNRVGCSSVDAIAVLLTLSAMEPSAMVCSKIFPFVYI